MRICAVVCRTQGDRPLLSKVTVATTQPSPSGLMRAPGQRKDKILGRDLGCLWEDSWV